MTHLKAAAALVIAAGALSGCGRGKERQPGDSGWPAYNKELDGQRFSSLNQINRSNVANLKPVCRVVLGESGTEQSGPLVVGRSIFVTTAHTTVALDAATCAVRWRYATPTSGHDVFPVNRGLAYLDGRVFRGTADGRLESISADSGKLVWSVQVGNPGVGEFVTSAPVAWNGKVLVGLAGSDWGIRGRVMAFDAATGKELWRFWTIPMGSEKGAETWKNAASAAHGGGGTWTSYALDPITNELFVPVGNPSPDFNPDVRPGDNLYTNSVVVLDVNSGALRSWFQLGPHDGFDWDLGAPPMLYRATDGSPRMGLGSKDGYVYAIDRGSNKQAWKTAVTTIRNAGMHPTPQGTYVCPGWLGGVEWNGPAYDPTSRTLYVGSVDWCGTVKSGTPEYKPGEFYLGTGIDLLPSDSASGWLTALDAETGTVKWKLRTPQPVVAGVTPTAGGVVFSGDVSGTFYALDATNGAVLLRKDVGGSLAGGVVTYSVDGTQYVAATAGNVSRVTFGGAGVPTLLVMGLTAPAGARDSTLPAISIPGDTNAAGEQLGATDGKRIFESNCSSCHGSHGEGGNGPSLQKSHKDLNAIVAFVKDPAPPMPAVYPSTLNDAQVHAVAEYVMTLRNRQLP